MDTVGGHRSHRLRIAVLLGYNTCHCRLLDVVMFSYSIVKRDECNNGERKSFFWFCCCWLQCKVCMQTFICTTSEVKCKEHAEARHPKSDLFTCFPHLKKWKTNNLIMYLEMGLKPSSVCVLLWVKIRKLLGERGILPVLSILIINYLQTLSLSLYIYIYCCLGVLNYFCDVFCLTGIFWSSFLSLFS